MSANQTGTNRKTPIEVSRSLVPCNIDNITSISYSILHGNLFDTDDDGRKDGTATAQSVADIACGGCPTGQGAADAGSGEVLFAGS